MNHLYTHMGKYKVQILKMHLVREQQSEKYFFPSSIHARNAGKERESILKFYAFDVQFYSIVDEKKKLFTSATCVNQFIEFRKFNWK